MKEKVANEMNKKSLKVEAQPLHKIISKLIDHLIGS